MKKILFIAFILTYNKAYLQNIITTKWHFHPVDTTIKDKDNTYWGLPWDIIEDKEGNLYLLTLQYFGWTVEKIETNTGKLIWKNGRNQNFPDNSGKMYIGDNMFELSNGNIEVLGTKSIVDYFFPILDGNPVKCVYDKDNGSELEYVESNGTKDKKITIIKPGIGRGFFKDNQNYTLISSLRDEGDTTHFFRKLDSNLNFTDTIGWYQNPTPILYKNKVRNLEDMSSFQKINQSINYLTFGWGGAADTSLYEHLYNRIGENGKLLYQKSLSKDFYYAVNYINYQPITNGFLVSGLVDTTFNIFKFHSKASNTFLVFNIDTLGNVVWKLEIKHPLGKIFETSALVQDVKRNGYWLFVGNMKQ